MALSSIRPRAAAETDGVHHKRGALPAADSRFENDSEACRRYRGFYYHGVTDGLPDSKQNTERAGALAGPTATAGGLVFIGAASDNRLWAFDSKTGKQSVAIVAGGAVNVYALP